MLTESWVEGKSVEEKDAQPTERTTALWGLSSKIDSRIWVNFTRNGLRLGSRHQEPPHTDESRNLATVVVRGVLPGLRRRRTGLLPSGPKFQMRESFVFNLETKVLESGGRVEKLIAQVAWSPVLSFHSLWWFAMSSAGVGPFFFIGLMKNSNLLSELVGFCLMWAKIVTIKRTKDLNYFSLCALNVFNTQVSKFELNYWNKWTFHDHLIYWDAPANSFFS